jgi:hypothetical protein
MTDLAVSVQPSAPDERIVAPAELEELLRSPRVIDGEVTGSWFPRPIWPTVVGSGALLALGLVSVVQEVLR